MTGPLASYTETFSYDDKKRVSSRTWSRDGQSYTISYQYNTGNQITQIVYPTPNRAVSITHDSVGRVSSIADQFRTYVNNFSYNGAGQLTGSSLGNGTTETYGYDTNRMQLISQTATAAGGQTNGLMNLHYYYQAQAGQMGAGTTAGNSGQLMAINNNSAIGGVTESASYTYDNYGRLVTSNQTSNGSSAQRRFAYDRWGNRNGVWDATSGGNQIQSVSLQTVPFPGTGGAPTNRITSVTSGSTLNYTYDANGNVTNDGINSYFYDSQNRLINSVGGGVSATYAYDHQNRRYKKTIGSSVTHYVWEGGHVVGEYNGSTGALLVQYGYAGTRMISKTGSGTTQYFLSDRLSVRLALSDAGVAAGRQGHLPFGEDFAESGTQEKHHFTSYERDGESTNDYAVNRQYVPGVGRFVSVDPQRNNLTLPQRLNAYAYGRDNPTFFNDPDGRGLRIIGHRLFFVSCQDIVINLGDWEDPDLEVSDTTDECELTPLGEVILNPQPEDKQPCQNVGGFLHPVGIYTPGELDAAAQTVFGEMSSHYNDNSRKEAEAIASIIFNRSEAIKSGTAPSDWGSDPSLTGVVTAPGQFEGFATGRDLRDGGVDLNEGERNCNRLQTAGSAVAWLATNRAASGSYLYMCAQGHVTARHPDDVTINHNVFSTQPLGCRP